MSMLLRIWLRHRRPPVKAKNGAGFFLRDADTVIGNSIVSTLPATDMIARGDMGERSSKSLPSNMANS
jgi:hypothetical protein